MPSREPMPVLRPRRLPLRRRSVERLACEPDTCRPAGKIQQQEADKLCRLRGGRRRTWGRELLVEGSHLLTRCDGRQEGLEFVVGGPPVARVQCARLSSEPLVYRLGLRKARRCRVGRRRLGRRGKTFQSKECLRFHALSSMPGQRGFVSERPLLSSATWWLGHGHRRRRRDIGTDVRDAAVRSPASPTLVGAARSSSPRSPSSRGPAASTRTWSTSRSSGQPRPASGCASARSNGAGRDHAQRLRPAGPTAPPTASMCRRVNAREPSM